MKIAAALLTALLSAQAAADCAGFGFEPPGLKGFEAAQGDTAAGARERDFEGREASLDCFRPVPAARERVELGLLTTELEELTDAFSRDSERYSQRYKSLAFN